MPMRGAPRADPSRCGESANDRKFASAIELYVELFPNDPDLPEILFRQGRLYYDRGVYDGKKLQQEAASQEAEQIVLTTMPEFKGADLMGMGASKNKPNLSETIVIETAMMGKIADSGKIIRILKKAHTVPFSDEKNWLLVDMDPAKGNSGLGIKWIPADTKFTWVRPYRDSVDENFADGKNPQDKGDSKRHGVPTKASVSNLRKVAKQGGRKGQLAHWMANMKAGRKK